MQYLKTYYIQLFTEACNIVAKWLDSIMIISWQATIAT